MQESTQDRRTFLKTTLAAGATLAGTGRMACDLLAAEPEVSNAGPCCPFFAFDNGTGRGVVAPVQQAKMLKELGYDGIGYTGTDAIPEMLDALDRYDLKMFSTYVRADVGEKKASFDPGLPEAIKQLSGRNTALWLFVVGKGDRAEQQTIHLVRQIAEMAAKSGLPVITYPHTGMYIECVEDSVRIAQKVGLPNVGASFNLCHWLKVDGDRLEARLRAALPQLRLVSINGADKGDTQQMGWNRLIRPLGQGSYDVAAFMRVLNSLGYRHPVGLQCYSVPGDRRENLQQSIQAWRKMCRAGT